MKDYMFSLILLKFKSYDAIISWYSYGHIVNS